MDFKTLRTVHLYLGCIFTPLLLFFVISGCLQTFGLHWTKKDGSYQAPSILRKTAEIHMHQRIRGGDGHENHSVGFRIFVTFMAAGFILTSILGILMALKFTKPEIVWGCLLAGMIIPLLCLYFF